MRTMHKWLGSLGFWTISSLGQLVGCSDNAADCKLNLTCTSDGTPYQGGGHTPEECKAPPSNDSSVVSNKCGIFVSSSASDDGNGSMAKPFKSLQAALDKARSTMLRVYACADDGLYAERVDVPAGVSVFGGFSCANGEWKYDAAKKARINPPAPASPDEVQASLRVAGSKATQLEDLRIEAANATLPGGSSIAVIVDGATVNFVRAEIIAGNGATGAQGATPTDDIGPADSDDPAVRGNDGQMACMGGGNGNPGGVAKGNEACAASVGGAGGFGKETGGDNGAEGLPQDPFGSFGFGGAGEGVTSCKSGLDGATGVPGMANIGAQDDGMLDAIRGHVGASGKNGGRGTVGQGGGGGGGAKGSAVCWGASGGSGGAGGCGGYGGLGGASGGSSIGIVSIGATIGFDAVTITSGNGGTGGEGGTGQLGAVGGNGGIGGFGTMAMPSACHGGNGGKGGDGGKGGGGRGGHSIGIAYRGGNVSEMGVTIAPGMPGAGGAGGGAMGGVGASTYAFP
ncbi:hypothetical protein [Polyangium fumosum]|uniref:hypothetical protein n=1 Tax=Polyangium fumosum TaxID=889272 RepID=UPI0014796283|nr:hypothetical protein [Polyangium fumosum]